MLLSSAEAAEMLGCSKQTLLRYVRAGLIKSIRYNRNFKFKSEDLNRFLDEHYYTSAFQVARFMRE